MLRIVRTEVFVADVDDQIHWYLEETGLEEIFAVELTQRFAAAVERNIGVSLPYSGRRTSASGTLF